MRKIYLLASLALCLNNYAQKFVHPMFDRTDNPSFMLDYVVITQDTMYVNCIHHAEGGMWANISKEMVLRNCKTNQEYPLLRCSGLPYAPERKSFMFSEKQNVVLFFEAPKSTTDKFDIIEYREKDGFNIYGINLQQQNDGSVYSYNFEHLVSLSKRADFFASTGNFRKAIELEEKSIDIKKAFLGCKSPGYAVSALNLASYYSMIGDYEKAVLWGKEDLNLCNELLGPKSEPYGISLLNLSSYYHSLGNSMEAEHYVRQAIALFHNLYGEQHGQYATAISNLAQILYAQGKYQEAIENDEKAMKTREQLFGKESNEYSMSLQSLSLCYAAVGDIPKAIDLTNKAINIKGNTLGKYDSSYIMCLNNLASFYSMKEEYEKAQEIELEALGLSESVYGTKHPEYAKILNNLGGYYMKLGKVEDAIDLTDKALQTSRMFLHESNNTDAIYFNNISQIYYQAHEYKKAVEYGLEGLQRISKDDPNYILFLSNIADIYANMNDYSKSVYYAEKAIVAAETYMSTEFFKLDAEKKYLYWQSIHSLFDRKFPEYTLHHKNDSTLSVLYDATLFSKNVVWRKKQSLPTWKDVQEKMSDEDIAIEFISPLFNDTLRFCALVLKKGQSAPKIKELFTDWQFIDSLTDVVSIHEKNKKVANLVWKPLVEELKGVKNIYFSPTHILHCIAIENLPYSNNTCYSDVFSMFRLSSTRQLLNPTRKKRYSKAVLYGGLEYEPSEQATDYSRMMAKNRSGFDYLINTVQEVNDIYDVLHKAGVGVTKYSGSNGTERSLRDLSGTSLDLLHLATHGIYIKKEDASLKKEEENYGFIQDKDSLNFYQSDAMSRAFLVMSNGNNLSQRKPVQEEDDGIATALDISNMDFSNVDMAVLSACESAMGEFGNDDGVIGLQRGFKIAGVNTIIMSLNKIDDEAAKIFMVEFYKQLTGGKSKLQSLKYAQKHLREVENGKYDKPEYWASFIMLDGLN